MEFWSKLFGGPKGPNGGSKGPNVQPPSSPPPLAGIAATPDDAPGNRGVHHDLLAYYRVVRDGTPPDPVVDRSSLDTIGFDTLSLAEMLVALGREHGLEPDQVAARVRASRVEIPAGEDHGWSGVANLVVRVGNLATSPRITDADRRTLITSGVAGPVNEVRAFHPLVTVGFVLKYCLALGL